MTAVSGVVEKVFPFPHSSWEVLPYHHHDTNGFPPTRNLRMRWHVPWISLRVSSQVHTKNCTSSSGLFYYPDSDFLIAQASSMIRNQSHSTHLARILNNRSLFESWNGYFCLIFK